MSVCASQYQELQEKVLSLPLYQPVFVNEYAPSDRFARKHWIDELQLEVRIKLYRYCHGNNLGNMTFLWQIPADMSEDPTSTAHAIVVLNSQQKHYCTREMRKDFILKYNRFVKAPISVLRNIYKSLVHDSSAATTADEQKLDDRVAQAIVELQDPEIAIDLRKLNGRVHSSFDDFWNELQRYLDELTTPVNERRHSESDAMYLPIAISVRDLRNIVAERLTEKFRDESKPTPSEEWIRLQFWPRNPYASNAFRYTGRFQVKYAVQARQMRKSHPDARYICCCYSSVCEAICCCI